MKKCLSLLLLLVASSPVPAADLFTPRVFDIVPPEGKTVQMVDGLTVLRQQGTKFGAAITFSPESGLTAWIPLAVLNTSGDELAVGTSHVSARYGDSELKVWSTTGMIREANRRRNEMLNDPPGSESMTMRERVRTNPVPQVTPEDGKGGIGAQPLSSGNASEARGLARDNDDYRRRDLADRQVEALKERLFSDQDLAPRKLARGEVRIDLPPQRDDGVPAEFVLTLAFGGETMDVLFRERDGSSVEVGEVAVPAAAAETETQD